MPKGSRYKALSCCGAALVLAMVAAVAPATAQFPPAPDDQPAAKGKKGAAAAGPGMNGTRTGELTRVGSSKSYVFYVEVITKGQAEKGGRCPDGTITLARQGNDLALGWFGTAQGSTVVAYGTLKKK